MGPTVSSPMTFSGFLADKEGDSWYLCFLNFQKFMMCNERSPVKLDEANLYNKGFWEYPCYDEVEKLLDICGGDLFEPLFEVYKVRIMSGNAKPQNTSRLQTQVDAYGTLSDRKSLYFWEVIHISSLCIKVFMDVIGLSARNSMENKFHCAFFI